jgi:CheY-like chemotaxis protein
MENVLVLDDDSAILDGVAEVLRSEHYSVLAASTGLQAIEIGRHAGRFSVLVTDIDLPDLSGTEVALALSRLYSDLLYSDLPVLFMSGYAIADWSGPDRSNLKRFTAGLVDFLEKPFSALELKIRVRKLIGQTSRPRTGSQAA